MYKRPVWVEVDLGAIAENTRTLKRFLAPETELMTVVKADAYGHGAGPVAETCLEAGASRLGVALLEEGIALREGGITAEIQILSPLPDDGADQAVAHSLTPTVIAKSTAEALQKAASRAGTKIKVHVKVDTGMNRLGLFPNDVPSYLRYLTTLDALEVEGIFTHFALADDPESGVTEKQLTEFKDLVRLLKDQALLPRMQHAANSAATIFFPETHLSAVRTGIATYGLHPSSSSKDVIELKPALCWKARVVQVKTLAEGAGVSYGFTYRASRSTKVAVVPAGYADGYSRLLSNKSSVLIKGRRAPVIGTVCMDLFMVDVGEITDAEVGDEAVLLGGQAGGAVTADELAGIVGTINYEIVSMISPRVPRTYQDRKPDSSSQ